MTPNFVFRERAREQLGRNIFSNNWLMALLVCLVASIMISIGVYLGGIVAWLVQGFLGYGLAHIFLSLVRGKRKSVEMGDLFCGGDKMGDLILLGLLKNLFIMLWSFLFIIPGIVKSYSYAMADYIKYDHPEYDANTCITESRAMMDGHKWRLFCLDFSFVGWMIVGSLVCGIGALWVTPYMCAARANFYDDLKAHYEPQPTAETVAEDAAAAAESTEGEN